MIEKKKKGGGGERKKKKEKKKKKKKNHFFFFFFLGHKIYWVGSFLSGRSGYNKFLLGLFINEDLCWL